MSEVDSAEAEASSLPIEGQEQPNQDEAAPDTEEAVETPQEDADDPHAKRIAKLAHKAREADRRVRQLQSENEILRGQRQGTPEDDDRKINDRAQQLAAAQAFTKRCNEIAAEGNKTYGTDKFQAAITNLNDSTGGLPFAMIEAADETGNPSRLLYHLYENPDLLDDMMALPPHRMGAAMIKLSAKLDAPKLRPVSKAPAPIKPVGGSVKSNVDMDKLPIEEWMAAEHARVYKSGR